MTACGCKNCRAECRRLPGWFTPAEATQAIAAGYAKRLTAVTQKGLVATATGIRPVDVTAISPARLGFEGRPSDYGIGRCTFFENDGKCAIHGTDFKPIECVTGFACRPADPGADMDTMVSLWQSPAGLAALALWRKAVA